MNGGNLMSEHFWAVCIVAALLGSLTQLIVHRIRNKDDK